MKKKTALIAKISMKYVLLTCIWKISGGFHGISRFLGNFMGFVEIPEFRRSATARNIRSPASNKHPHFSEEDS